jgi:hypothetical protein
LLKKKKKKKIKLYISQKQYINNDQTITLTSKSECSIERKSYTAYDLAVVLDIYDTAVLEKRKRKPRMDKSETTATLGTQDKHRKESHKTNNMITTDLNSNMYLCYSW